MENYETMMMRIRYVQGWYLVVLCGMIELGLWRYGSEVVFESWVQCFRVPLDLFERITICGRQLASILYFTRGFAEDHPKDAANHPFDPKERMKDETRSLVGPHL